ncbi:MAG TPA: glycosyltransferase family 87 protein [Rhizomicrobium sp.]
MRNFLPADLSPENRGFLRDLVLLGAIAFLALAAVYLWLLHGALPFPKDGSSLVVGRDFLNFWMYGRAALGHAAERFYDPNFYHHLLQGFLGANYPRQNWSYPPDIMLLAAPFGLIGYLPALLCWTIIGFGVLFIVARGQWKQPALTAALFVAPATAFCLMSGQSSLLTTALLVTVFACLDRRPLLAGVLIGLLTLKPQLGLLLPVMLCASGRWRVLFMAAATTAVLFMLSIMLFGLHAWQAYLELGIPVQNSVLSDPRLLAAPFMPTIFMNLHAVGASYTTAMTVQVVIALLAAVTVFWAFRHRNGDPDLQQALFFACAMAATPYLLSYDSLPLVFAGLALLKADALDAAGRRLVQLVFWLPFLQLGLGILHIPGPALIAPAFAVWLALRLAGKTFASLFSERATA